jgi:hypothetical protein
MRKRGTYRLVDLGASISAQVLELLLGIGAVAGQVSLDGGRGLVDIAYGGRGLV